MEIENSRGCTKISMAGLQQCVTDERKSLEAFQQARRILESWEWKSNKRKRQKSEKPPQAVDKVNWDAAIDVKNKKMGVGVIVRDADGLVSASMCTTVLYITDLTLAEAVVTGRLLFFAKI